jgi:SOS-response transcriptional repressor LexA
MAPLTKRQAEMVGYIRDYIAQYGYAPSLGEIGAALGLRSLATVYKHLEHLEAKGVLRRRWNRSRSIELLSQGPVTAEMVSAFEAGWDAACRVMASGRPDTMATARAQWLEARS